jgi:hypothetical protein
VGPFAEPARSLARAVAYLPDVAGAALLALAAAFVPGGRGGGALAGVFAGASARVLARALAQVPAPVRLNRALVVFTVACLIDAGLIGALALLRLTF